MFVYKCDICKKEIKESGERVSVRVGYSSDQMFCATCAKPVIVFLKQHKFIKPEYTK